MALGDPFEQFANYLISDVRHHAVFDLALN